MKILLAPDSLKESLSAEDACKAMERGIKEIFPDAEVHSMPMADGGEGTVNALVNATNGRIIRTRVHDPLMRWVESFYGVLGDGETTILEVAAASGLELLTKDERNPMKTSSYGTGELILHALDAGCKKIIIGLGGSATNDGGAGMAMALGVKFMDVKGEAIIPTGESIGKLLKIDVSQLDQRIKEVSFTVACDVTNPLYGESGASVVFGPQKGATLEMIQVLDNNLLHYAKIIDSDLGISVGEIAGSGAAGGLGAGLLVFLNAKLQSGYSVVSEYAGLENCIKYADLILTAEGKTDGQTLSGKVPLGVGLLGKKYHVPVLLFTGSMDEGAEKLYDHGIGSIIPICSGPVTLDYAISHAGYLLQKATERTFRLLKISKIFKNQ